MNDLEHLRQLAGTGKRFRATPIVDDDFPSIRDEFDEVLNQALTYLAVTRPTIVCLCGSTRFMKEFREANLLETLAGKIVLTIGCDTKSDDAFGLDLATKERLDALHLQKINLSDEVLILDVGGYIGSSTRREIDCSKKLSKRIRYWSQEISTLTRSNRGEQQDSTV